MTAIFIPTLKRAYKIPGILQNIEETTPQPHKIWFIVEDEDTETQKAILLLNGNFILNQGKPNYASCINTAYLMTTEPYFFVAADDVKFHKDWLLNILKTKNANENALVIGTRDLFNPTTDTGESATHYFVTRKYIDDNSGTMDRSFPVLYEYFHNYTDTEFIATAKKRNVFVHCPEAIVEHLHWGAKKSTFDEVYEKGNAHVGEDQQTFNKRRNLWL